MSNTPQQPAPAPNSQTKLLAGFVQQQIGEVKTMLTALQDRVETVAKAVGGMPDRLTDRLLMRIVRSRHSYLLWTG